MQEISFSSPIKDIFLHSKETEKYLLLSINSAEILWVVKIQGKEKEFWELIQLILPYGVTIKGLAINNEHNSIINGLYLVNKKNELQRREIISNCFWIISFKITKEPIEQILVNDNSIEIDFDNFINSRSQRSLKNLTILFTDQPMAYFDNNYVKVYCAFQKEINIKQQINEEEEIQPNQFDFENRDILIHQIGIKISNQCQIKDWKLNQNKYSNYIKENNSIELLYMPINNCIENQYKNDSILSDLNYSKTLSPQRLSENKKFTISLNAIFEKKMFLKELIEKYKEYARYIINKMIKINKEQKPKVSSFIINSNIISLPICLIYSVPQEIKHFISSLINQSNYFKMIFGLKENDRISYSYLANHFDFSLESSKSSYLSTEYFINIHQHLRDNNDNKCIINGDYLTCLCHFEDKTFGTGYRAIQTLVSWFYFNNNDQYPYLTIPTIQDIKQSLILLGELTTNDIDKPYSITINQLSLVLSFLIDLQCESNSIFRSQLAIFKQELEAIYYNTKHEPSPVILSIGINSFYTVIGYDKELNEILVISHEYIGKISLINSLKMNIIQWVNIDNFFNQTKKFDFLTVRYVNSLE